MDTQTMEYLDGRGFIKDGRVWRAGIIGQLADALRARPADSLDAVGERALTIPEWRSQVLGDPDSEPIAKELDNLCGQLLAVGDRGPVQKALENGHVLCGPKVQRVVAEGEAPKNKTGRVLSSDADVIERHLHVPQMASALKRTAAVVATIDMSVRRVPELTARRQQLFGRSREQLEQLLLTNGSGS
jgi:hypothetical protein